MPLVRFGTDPATFPCGIDIVLQAGYTPGELFPGKYTSFAGADLSTEIRESDVVIAHCGTDIALSALQAGKIPILIPRRRAPSRLSLRSIG
jgi:hypothetical protein